MSCSILTGEGASVMRSAAFCVLGKAMTSRMDSAPVMSMIDRFETEGDSPVGRRAVFQGVEQEAELGTGFFFGKPEGFKDHLLYPVLVDADAAAADLGAVQDEVVGPGPRLRGVRV